MSTHILKRASFGKSGRQRISLFAAIMEQRSSPRRSSRTPSPHGGARIGAGRPLSDDMEAETPDAPSPSRLSSMNDARSAVRAEKASLAESHALLKG